MAVQVKIAQSAQELSDVYRLRYQVYHDEKGYFPENMTGYIIDIYDSIPNSQNIIAYYDGQAVGTMRALLDSEIGTSADEAYDFSLYREKISTQSIEKGEKPPVFVSAGMLAIAEKWRNRRDVFLAIIRMAVDIGNKLGGTHIIATVNENTISIYKRIGWEILDEKVWIEEIHEFIVPVAISVDQMYRWAFDMLQAQKNLLAHFSGCFQWYLLDKGTTIFHQGEIGKEAYLITKGSVDINCQYQGQAKALSLATLGVGDMFGELSLIDDAPRSASAMTQSNCELLVINRDIFWEKIHQNPDYLRDLMGVLSARLRSADERAMLYAYAPLEERFSYFLNGLKHFASPDPQKPGQSISKTTVQEFADMALASLEEAQAFLDKMVAEQKLQINPKNIIFIN